MRTSLSCPLCHAQLTPLSESGDAVGLEVIALGEASVLIEMVVNGNVDSNEFLQGSHAPEADHCPLSSLGAVRRMRTRLSFPVSAIF